MKHNIYILYIILKSLDYREFNNYYYKFNMIWIGKPKWNWRLETTTKRITTGEATCILYQMFIYVYFLSKTTFLRNRQLINDTINICKRIVSMISRVLFIFRNKLSLLQYFYLQLLKITSGFVSCSTMGLWKTGLQLTGMILLWRIRYYGLTLRI